MTHRAAKEFTWIEGLALFLCWIAIQLSSEWITQWGTYLYSPAETGKHVIYVAIGLAATIFFFGYIVSAISDPLVGLWSDKMESRPGRWRIVPIAGRRRPFIFWGSIGITFTGILFWYPPVQGESILNFAYATTLVCVHWLIFAMCSVPFTSLGPEIARSQEGRAKIGTWLAAGMIVGLAIAVIAPGFLVDLLDPARGASGTAPEGATASPAGFQRTAILFALVSLVLFQFTVWTVRERYQSDVTPTRTSPLGIAKQALSNVVFLKYLGIFFFFNIGYLAVQRVLPYWVEVGLNSPKSTVSILMAPYIFGALAALGFTSALLRRIPLKWLIFVSLGIITTGLPLTYFIAVAGISTSLKIVLGGILFTYCGIGQGMQYVLLTPMIGEIIDLDEQRSGERREAVYQSLSGLAWKGAQALSVYAMAIPMQLWGKSPEHPMGIYIIGPIAGVFGLLGMALCLTYPILHVTRESPVSVEAPGAAKAGSLGP